MTGGPAWLSVLPPLVAIGLALVLRQVVVALLVGAWLGATLLNGYNPLTGLLRAADTFAIDAMADPGHASILLFTLLLGGMIGVVQRSGGGAGLAALVTKRAHTPRAGQLGTWGLGLLVFFDDYANTLLVGSTLRPVTDRLKISREKLAFLVDATAAPVSSIAIISTWIGVEVGYIADQFQALGIERDPFLAFIATIPYRTYPLLMLAFGFMIAWTGRDFGPMRRAEHRARRYGKLLSDKAQPISAFGKDADEAAVAPRKGAWALAVAPIGALLVVAALGMYFDGKSTLHEQRHQATAQLQALQQAVTTEVEATEEVHAAELVVARSEPTLRNIFSRADSLKVLLWASFVGCLIALVVAIGSRALSVQQSFEAWLSGLHSMVLACVILVLAWSIGAVCRELKTAEFLIQALGDGLPAGVLPASVFVLSAAISFATGTSYGTMAILFPLVVPIAYRMGGEGALMIGAVSSILAGSVWGDHCSPISDTTIMSSMAASCDHTDHVRTQLPYALLVGGVSLLLGELATGFGLYGPWVALGLGVLALAVVVRFLGRPSV